MRECDGPVPLCSAFRLLSSLSYSHAWPFAVAKAFQVCTRNHTSPVAVEEPPFSRDPTSRPLRRSLRHPWLSLRRRCMSSCGAETHLLFSGHSAIDANDTSARAAPGVHVGQPAPKAASKVSHEARRSSEECVGSHASHCVPITNRHDSSWFASFRYYHFALFWSFWLTISEPGWTSRKKVPLAVLFRSTRPGYGRFWSR